MRTPLLRTLAVIAIAAAAVAVVYCTGDRPAESADSFPATSEALGPQWVSVEPTSVSEKRVACGEQTCGPSEDCCLGRTERENTCVKSSEACSGPRWACDDTADCPERQICCTQRGGAGRRCEKSCRRPTDQACASDADCDSGKCAGRTCAVVRKVDGGRRLGLPPRMPPRKPLTEREQRNRQGYGMRRLPQHVIARLCAEDAGRPLSPWVVAQLAEAGCAPLDGGTRVP